LWEVPLHSQTYSFFGLGLCGASLIYEDILVTVAHCRGAFDDGVIIGVHNLLSDPNDGLVRIVQTTLYTLLSTT